MNLSQRIAIALTLVMTVIAPGLVASEALDAEVKAVYDNKLKELFLYFHQNPELSTMEHSTSARLADELTALGYTVTRNVGGTGIVALLENGEGPLVMFRADMDGLPVRKNRGSLMRRGPSRSIRMVMKCLSCMPAATTCTSPAW